MVGRSYLVASLLIFGSLLLNSVQATDRQILHVELAQMVKDCNLNGFIAGYGILESQFDTVNQKANSLASFNQTAQETKKEKLATLAKVLSRGKVKAYLPFAKCMAQLACTCCAGVVATVCIGSRFLNPEHVDDHALLGVGIGFSAITMPFMYYAKNNYQHAFHPEVYIKNDITQLNEILAFIESQKD